MADLAPPLSRFDGAAAWPLLAPDSQASIGALALELAVALSGEEELLAEEAEGPTLPPRKRAILRALSEVASAASAELITDARTGLCGEVHDGEGLPLVPSLIGDVCRSCGCSQDDACQEGCGWAADSLCTACAEPEVGNG